MATVTKDFRIKSGLVVEGANATVDGSDIITEDAITGGTQTNIAVTYDAQNKVLNFVAENGVADSTTDDLAEGEDNLYYTNERVDEHLGKTNPSGANGFNTPMRYTNGEISLNLASESGLQMRSSSVGTGLGVNVKENAGLYIDGSYGVEIDRNTVDTWYDPAGAAATAEQNANNYTDAAVGAIPSAILSVAGDTGTDSVTLDGDTLTVSGGTGITTSVANDTITVDIDSTVVTLEGTQNLKNKSIENATVISGLDANNNKITNLATPTASADAATKAYVDAVAEGLHIHASAAVATTTNIADLSDGPGTVDGVALNDTLNVYTRVLVKSQTNAAQNGIYVATKAGSGKWVYTRAADFDSPAEVDGGDFIFVTEGNLYSNTGWVQTTAGVTTIGTDPIEFTQFSGAGTYTAGTGLDLNGTEFVLDLSEVSTTDLPEGTNLYFTDQRAFDAVDGSSTINFVEVELNSIAKQVAATYTTGTGNNVVFAFPDTYRSGKFLVKLARGTHTEVSEVLVTLDTSDNIAITEYAVVGTNGSLGTISATYDGINENVQITVNTPSATNVKVVGTIIE